MRAPILSALGLVLALGCASRGRDDDRTRSPQPIASTSLVYTIDPFAPPAPEPHRETTVMTAEQDVESDEPATPEPTVVSPLGELEGAYHYSGGSVQKSAVKAAVESVVDEMNALARGIARKRLNAANEVPSRLSIAAEGERVTVRLDGTTYTATLGGKSVKVRDADGNRSRLRYEMHGESLHMILDGDEGDRFNVFTPRNDGKGVTMRVTMKSSKLPKSVVYRLSYRG